METDDVEDDHAQPDFNEMGDSLMGVLRNVVRCKNLPATQQGLQIAHVLQAVNDMRNDMQLLRNDVRTDMQLLRTDVRTEVQLLRNEMRTLDYNQQARLQNSQLLRRPDEPLSPLRSLQTHQDIPNFPYNTTAIDQLSTQAAGGILAELNAFVPAGVNQGRAAVKRAVGVYAQYVAV